MSMWKAIEADAWSRCFNYDEYVSYCNLARMHHVSKVEYELLCAQFEAEMIEDLKGDVLDSENFDEPVFPSMGLRE